MILYKFGAGAELQMSCNFDLTQSISTWNIDSYTYQKGGYFFTIQQACQEAPTSTSTNPCWMFWVHICQFHLNQLTVTSKCIFCLHILYPRALYGSAVDWFCRYSKLPGLNSILPFNTIQICNFSPPDTQCPPFALIKNQFNKCSVLSPFAFIFNSPSLYN